MPPPCFHPTATPFPYPTACRSDGLDRSCSDRSGVVVGGGVQPRGIWRTIGLGQLHRIADEKPCTLVTGDRSLDEDQAALGVGADDFQILLRALTVAHVAGHLLVLEDLARILAVTR